MEISQDGIDLIKDFEGCRLRSYQDSKGIDTIGYGHTSGVDAGMCITQQQADEWLAEDLEEFSGYVNRYVTSELTQHQFDALVSFAYNLGPGTLYHSKLLTYVNANDFDRAADVFLQYDHSGGVKVAGLTKRREAERDLFLLPDMLPNELPKKLPRINLVAKVKNWLGKAKP